MFFESKVLSRAIKFIVELAFLLLQGFTIYIIPSLDYLFSKHIVILIQNGSRNVLDLHVVVTHRLEKYKMSGKGASEISRHGMKVWNRIGFYIHNTLGINCPFLPISETISRRLNTLCYSLDATGQKEAWGKIFEATISHRFWKTYWRAHALFSSGCTQHLRASPWLWHLPSELLLSYG